MKRRLFGPTIALLFLAGASPPQKEPPKSAAGWQSNPSPTNPDAYPPSPKDRKGRCPYGDDRSSAQLCEEWRSATAAEEATELAATANWIGGAGAGLTLISICLLIWTLILTHKSNNTARDALLGQNRPHIKLRRVFVESQDAHNLRLRLEATNWGKGTAHVETGHLSIEDAKLLPPKQPWWGHKPDAWNKAFLESAEIEGKPAKPVILPPGGTALFYTDISLSDRQAYALEKGHFTVVGFLSYRDGKTGGRQYHTDFARRYNPKTGWFTSVENSDYESAP